MPTLQEAFDLALQHHRAGRTSEAERLYQQILSVAPEHGDAIHLLGVLQHQRGEHRLAVETISRAIELNNRDPFYYNNLGAAWRALGEPARAEACYRQSLALHPAYAEAFNNLANALIDRGEIEEAIACLRRATDIRPDLADALYKLASLLEDKGDHAESFRALERAIAARPDFADAHNSLGFLHYHAGRHEQAIACYERALEIRPTFAEAAANLGNVFLEQRRFREAMACFHRALQHNPALPEAYNSLGTVFLELRKFEEAEACFRTALQYRPGYAIPHYNLGNVCKEREQFEEAIAHFQRAIELQPELPAAHQNLGSVYNMLERLEEAEACYQRTLELNPRHIEAHSNLGSVHQYRAEYPQAMQCFRRALALQPENADVRMNIATLGMLQGDWPGHLNEYEQRWQSREFAGTKPRFAQPEWQGESLAARTLLVYAEQGFGDSLQFVRYLEVVRSQGAKVLFQCPAQLVPLMQESLSGMTVLPREAALPAFDFHLPLLSMMRIFGTTPAAVPNRVPYLRARGELVDRWRERLSGWSGVRIGLNWRGRGGTGKWRLRDLPPAQLARLADVPGVTFFSLQAGAGTDDERKDLAPLRLVNFDDELDRASGPFMDTAAIMESLHLVITSDTSVAHLAGGLARSTWLVLPLVPDWRWLLAREDSPWYPTLRLFRQTARDNWDATFTRLVAELRQLVSLAER